MTMDRKFDQNQTEEDVSTAFGAWLSEERQKGLVDIKFALNASPRNNPSVEKVMQEVLRCEADVAAGNIEEPHYDY